MGLSSLISGAGCLLWLTLITACQQGSTNESRAYALADAEVALLQPGDIILRRGDGLVSDAIASVLQEPYDVTHCGILMRQANGDWAVVHAMQDDARQIDGVIAQGLGQFVSESRRASVIVLRYCADSGSGSRMSDVTRYYLQQAQPFDRSFDIHDSTRLYCSELLQHIYMDCYGVDIFPMRIALPTTDLLRYTYLFQSDVFNPILNHQR